MKLPLILLWKRHLCPLLNWAGGQCSCFSAATSFTLFSLKCGKHVISYLQNVLANFLNFFCPVFCKLFKCGLRLQPHLARLWNSKSSFCRCTCGQCVSMPMLQSAFAGTIYRESIRNERRKMWTIQDFVVTASRLTF